MTATHKIIGGYVWRQQIAIGRLAVKRARLALEELSEKTIADISLALLEISETYTELEKIGRANDRDSPIHNRESEG